MQNLKISEELNDQNPTPNSWTRILISVCSKVIHINMYESGDLSELDPKYQARIIPDSGSKLSPMLFLVLVNSFSHWSKRSPSQPTINESMCKYVEVLRTTINKPHLCKILIISNQMHIWIEIPADTVDT